MSEAIVLRDRPKFRILPYMVIPVLIYCGLVSLHSSDHNIITPFAHLCDFSCRQPTYSRCPFCQAILNLNDTQVAELAYRSPACGYEVFSKVTYPPPGTIALPNKGQDIVSPGPRPQCFTLSRWRYSCGFF